MTIAMLAHAFSRGVLSGATSMRERAVKVAKENGAGDGNPYVDTSEFDRGRDYAAESIAEEIGALDILVHEGDPAPEVQALKDIESIDALCLAFEGKTTVERVIKLLKYAAEQRDLASEPETAAHHVAARYGLPREHVTVTYDWKDGGPLWGVHVPIIEKGREKRVSGVGKTLALACVMLAADYELETFER